jgi:hypothetical protein
MNGFQACRADKNRRTAITMTTMATKKTTGEIIVDIVSIVVFVINSRRRIQRTNN